MDIDFDINELDYYNEYMVFVFNLLRNSNNITPKAKKSMFDSRGLNKKDQSTWYLQYKNEIFEFISYYNYRKMEDRNEKLSQLGI